jgi:hypothetical protein
MYSFFKSFPLVYGEGGYGWNLGVSNLPFLGIVVGEGLGVGGYALWNWYISPDLESYPDSKLMIQVSVRTNVCQDQRQIPS